MKRKKIALCGSPEFIIKFFEVFLKDYSIEFILTQFPKKLDKNGNLIRTEVALWGEKNNLKVYEVKKIKEFFELKEELKKLDFVLTFAFGQIIPESFLDLPKYGWFNVHPSKLPIFRGPSPLQYALLNNFQESAISLMQMNKKMDEGNIIAQKIFKINKYHNINALINEISTWGPNWILSQINEFLLNQKNFKQSENATYSYLIKKEDYYIKNESTIEILNKIRAFGYVFLFYNNLWIKCFLAKIPENDEFEINGISPIFLQLPGKKILHIRNFLNGLKK